MAPPCAQFFGANNRAVMGKTWPVSLSDTRTFWVVATIGCLLCLTTNLPWQLDDYDQAKQAFSSYEMVKQGHWLYQHTPRTHLATKPPLVGWISAGLFEMTRSWDLAWRLPSFAAAVALAFSLARAGRSAYGATAGLIALAAFTLNLLTPRLATLVRTDMPLALILFLTGLSIWQHIWANKPWDTRDRVWIFILLTAGMLIKGPIVYAFLLPGLLYFQWWRRKAGGASAWCGWWPWVASLAIFLVWAMAGIRFVPGFYDQVVMHEFVGRFGETIHRPQPLYFYVPHLLHKFAPWSVLLIVFTWMGWRARTGEAAAPASRLDMMWLICWSLGGLIVMSCVPSKRVDRIFPVIPPLCLLLAAAMDRFSPNESRRILARRWAIGALICAVLLAGGYNVSKVVSGYRGHREAVVQFGHLVREQAAAHGWRYEAVPGSDEGILLYLDKTAFLEPGMAVATWNAGELDALVVPAEKADAYLRDLQGPVVAGLKSAQRAEQESTYVLLIHER
jgi:4-amino-4-deoxy-L-arabinose transferase-like glycosyltransferase